MPPSANRQRQSDFYPRPPRGGRRGFTPVPHQSGLFLSTPSARRATCAIAAPKDRHSISIHALREEGDLALTLQKCGRPVFLSTPSARRATTGCASNNSPGEISIHALREEGDLDSDPPEPRPVGISIHALREEGDSSTTSILWSPSNFYPRPPRGGRLAQQNLWPVGQHFYPRPPRGGRPDPEDTCECWEVNFYPRPPRGGRPGTSRRQHRPATHFYPRPPRGGRRSSSTIGTSSSMISIHALREEGDPRCPRPVPASHISIHALREEGDPRRPRLPQHIKEFLSTPSARRATRSKSCCSCSTAYFYPRPPRGGRRPRPKVRIRRPSHFYPRPPRGGRHLRQHVRSGIHPISIHALREEGDPLPGLR